MISSNALWSPAEVNGSLEYNVDLADVAAKNTWHKLFESPQWILSAPAEEVVLFYLKYLENPSRQFAQRSSIGGRKLHDLGCGGGRHMYYFAELGFDVTGSDLSDNAIAFTKQELHRRQLNAKLVKCPMTDLPFDDGEFDITISRATLNHATLQGMKQAIAEVARTTHRGGVFFLTVSSDRASDFGKGKEVTKNLTYIPQKGPEEGLVHTFFSASNAAALVEPFFVVEEVYLSEHPPLITSAPGATDPDEYFGSEYIIIGIRR